MLNCPLRPKSEHFEDCLNFNIVSIRSRLKAFFEFYMCNRLYSCTSYPNVLVRNLVYIFVSWNCVVQLSLVYLRFQSILLDASLPKFRTGYVPKEKVDWTCLFPGEDPKQVETDGLLLYLFLTKLFLKWYEVFFSLYFS